MKLWKKLICVLLALTLSASMLSCGGTSDGEAHTADGEDTASENPKEPDNAEDTEIPAKEPVKEGTFVDFDGTVRQVTVHEGADGLVTFLIDAEVLNKDAADLPIIEVTSDAFTSEEFQMMIAPFVGDFEVYEFYDEWFNGDYSRTYVTDYQYHPEEYYNAPNRESLHEPDPNRYEFAAFSMVDDLPRIFSATYYNGINNFSVGLWSMVYDAFSDYFYQKERFNEESIELAKADVRSYLDSAGLEEWQFVRCEQRYEGAGKVYLEMEYNLSYHDIPLLRASESSGSYSWNIDVRGDLQYHEMLIYYSNDMICMMLLRSPLTVVSEEPQTLISYDEAVKAICRELEVNCKADEMMAEYEEKFSWSENTVLSWNVYVDKLELVYVRVPSADTPEHYYLIPAWVAYGGHGISEQVRNNVVVTVDNKFSGDGEPLAFISAIDGTSIDFENGY